ncbi:MAG: hypothetical protein N2D54_09805, partial [Chloroflexota bacterium]
MAKKNKHDQRDVWDQVDPLEVYELESNLPKVRNLPRIKNKTSTGRLKSTDSEPLEDLGAEKDLDFTYMASRHERTWIINSLEAFYKNRWIDDVLRVVKGGKEASVYQCASNEFSQYEYIAAKIYRPRMFRSLRNDSLYRQGRSHLDQNGNKIIDDGKLHAMRKGSRLGLELTHQSWIAHEFATMQLLHSAGVDMPEPLACGDNAILMAYIGSDVLPAPVLNAVNLEEEEAISLFRRCIRNLEIMLKQNRIHGDYSAYNILYWEGEIIVIDFPQAIDPFENPSARMIFDRDVLRICEYFKTQGVPSNPQKIAADLWQRHGHQEITE